MVVDSRLLAGSCTLPQNIVDYNDVMDSDLKPSDPHDHNNTYSCNGVFAPAAQIDLLARFIQELKDLSSMKGPDVSSAVDDVPGFSVCHCHRKGMYQEFKFLYKRLWQ